MPTSSSRGVMSLMKTSACRWTRSWVRVRDELELLADGQAVGRADGEPGGLPALQPGDAHHVELVEVAGEDRQELHPLQQRQRLVLGELQDAGVEVQPGQLPVQEAVGRQRRGRPGRALGGTGSSCRTEVNCGRSAAVQPQPARAAPWCGARRRARARRAGRPSVSTSRTRPGQVAGEADRAAGRCASADAGPNCGRSGVPTAVSSVVPVPWASATNARGTPAGRREGRGQLAGAQCRQVGGERRDARPGGAAGAVLERRVQPAVGLVGDRPRPEPADDVGGGGVVGHHDHLGDGRAGERGGDGVGEQGQHERRRGRPRSRPEAGGQRPQPGLGDGEPLRRDDDRPAAHGPM